MVFLNFKHTVKYFIFLFFASHYLVAAVIPKLPILNSITDVQNKPTAALSTTVIIPSFIPNSPTICVGEALTFTNTSLGALNYSWDFGDGGNSLLDNPIYTYTSNGKFIVTMLAMNGTVQATYIDSVFVNNKPNANLTITQIDKCNGTVQFTCLSSYTNNVWAFSDGTNYSDSCSIVKQFTNAQTYTVTHVINPNTFCSATATQQFSVVALNSDLGNIPNVITPNDDGVNDWIDFSSYTKCGNFEYSIFNRWGLIIISSDITKQSIWDGRTTSGEIVTAGTYFYTIKKSNNTYKGTITVFR